ncbi:uncharacterized protein SPPG_01432 [Spizellomyces punctatus DAOM BR117]|uniref:Roadblock/LAMTOR2 domain-containing protein n=1 Tax=Spizellomyces punctatus (strain DAOM BR117) TaxID=645134 RepID=A0A0L0HSY4_SPIPD|nr:uncharacterized protein SPPG_01432 [Spizellomyces punctatus DAOM BR117]KND03984.1 hypothetical protein SPPG_01432 [Spizellomyces punctatus DAOM BR117]|eukprot:XP_016612023.1 hypothetical protein SPPG_01432 [Spizellomyces punctatus DAOM BR117]
MEIYRYSMYPLGLKKLIVPCRQLQAFLQDLLESTDHLKAVLVTDKDGVILAKATGPDLPDHVLEPAFSATFSVASDQSGKLGFGRNKMIMSTFDEDQVVQFNYSPLILTLLASSKANSGVLIAAGKDLEEPIKIVGESVSKAIQHEHKAKEYV